MSLFRHSSFQSPTCRDHKCGQIDYQRYYGSRYFLFSHVSVPNNNLSRYFCSDMYKIFGDVIRSLLRIIFATSVSAVFVPAILISNFPKSLWPCSCVCWKTYVLHVERSWKEMLSSRECEGPLTGMLNICLNPILLTYNNDG